MSVPAAGKRKTAVMANWFSSCLISWLRRWSFVLSILTAEGIVQSNISSNDQSLKQVSGKQFTEIYSPERKTGGEIKLWEVQLVLKHKLNDTDNERWYISTWQRLCRWRSCYCSISVSGHRLVRRAETMDPTSNWSNYGNLAMNHRQLNYQYHWCHARLNNFGRRSKIKICTVCVYDDK